MYFQLGGRISGALTGTHLYLAELKDLEVKEATTATGTVLSALSESAH
jgi:hypothetical protein